VPYDPVRDFTPVTMAAFTPNILLVHPSLPVNSVKDLVRLAKSRPGELNVSSGGNGSVGHLAAEMFKTAAGVNIVHVPYKGPVAAVTALISGEASLGFLIVGAALPQVKAGKLRALAVTGKNRSPAAPELPTIAEAGVPDYEIVAWQGVFAPAGTPSAIISKLNADIVAVLRMNEIKQALLRQGLETIAGSAPELGAYVKEDLVKWARVVKQANVHID
jgi:tripartite-type tricarboxylate transporter receptor subunit TctC